MEKTYQMEGYTLHLIPTKKFKTVTMALYFQSPLEKETTTIRTLLTLVLSAASNSYPSTQALAMYLEEQYGARLSTHITSKGQSHIMSMKSHFVNENYLPGDNDLLKQQVQLFEELLFHPLVTHDAFDDNIVAMKKKELKERLQANKDDKYNYAVDRVLEYMGHDQTLGIPSSGYEDEIDHITSQDVYRYFLSVLENDNKHLYVIGDIDETIVDLFAQSLAFSKTCKECPTDYAFVSQKKEILEVIETQDITQSKLQMGYCLDTHFTSDDHYACMLMNTIFGGGAQSKLFKVVREQHSLCYHISSQYDAFNGVMLVGAGIQNDHYDKTKTLIQEQLEEMKAGCFSDEDVHIAQISLQNMFRKTFDEAGSTIALAYHRALTHQVETIDELIKKIQDVTKEDIVKVAQKVNLDTIFFLTGKENYGSH